MSALQALENAVLTFVVPAAGTTVDPETGNVVANTATIECAAFLKAESVAEATYPGVSVVSTLYEGYITSGALDSRGGGGRGGGGRGGGGAGGGGGVCGGGCGGV